MSKIDNLFVEKWRPHTFEDYIFVNDHEKKKVKKWIDSGSPPHVLAFGPPGVGKSSVLRMMINELKINPGDIQIVNASTKGIAYVTEQLIPWMKRAPYGNFRLVLLEEIDKMSDAAMKALRFEMEEYSDTVRFFATANYVNKIEPALLSRFQTINIESMDRENIEDYVADVLEVEGITFNDIEDVTSHLDAYEPDIRKILNSIDEHTDADKVLHKLKEANKSQDIEAWENVWLSKKPLDPEELLDLADMINENNFDAFYEAMYQNSSKFKDESKAIVLMSEYLDRAYRSANQPMHLKAFIYRYFYLENDEENE